MALLDELATYLAANGIGTVGGAGGNIFAAVLPDTPDNAICLYEIPGRQGVYTYGAATGSQVERPRVEVIVRNTTYPNAKSKAYDVYTLLDKVAGTTMTGTLYQRISAVAAPHMHPGGRDTLNRYRLRIEFDVWKAVS